ncbi:MAG: glycosyltransferase family 4 protein [Gemmataceae bacterium]|nr:glycosyltransferase family 4 protein [Gemmataceae bacterium]
MRLAHFIQRYPPALGGSEAYFHRLGRHLVARGHDVTVFTAVADDLAAFWSPGAKCLPVGEEVIEGIAVRRFPIWRMRGRRWILKPLSLVPLRAWQAMTLPCNPVSVAMWRAAGDRAAKFDAVHATAFPYAWPIACAHRLARRLGVPFLLTPFLHLGDLDDPADATRRQYLQPALRRLLRAADRVFVQTDPEFDAALAAGVAPHRLVRQGLGVEPAECTGGNRVRARATWGVSDSEVVIGHLANLSIEKGSVDLVRAAERLAGRRTTLVLAGPAMPNFESACQQIAPHVRVTRPGRLSDADRRDFFAGIDAFALPSRSDSFGLVLLEAWANGKPVLAYRAGGPGAIVRDGVDGWLARCGDVEQLTHCLEQACSHPAERERRGKAGQARCAREFRWDDKLNLVDETLRTFRSSPAPAVV